MGLGDIEAGLHAHEGFHRHAEGLLYPDRHIRGQRCPLVHESGERSARDSQRPSGVRYGKSERLDDLRFDETSGMGWILHANAGCIGHGFAFLVVVPLIEVDDFDLGLIDPERDPPVLGDKQAPDTFPVAGPYSAK